MMMGRRILLFAKLSTTIRQNIAFLACEESRLTRASRQGDVVMGHMFTNFLFYQKYYIVGLCKKCPQAQKNQG